MPTNHSHFKDVYSREWLEMLIYPRVNLWYSVYDRRTLRLTADGDSVNRKRT